MTVTADERLRDADREIEQVKDAFLDAIARLHEAPEVDDASFVEPLQQVDRRLRDLRGELRPEDLDKDQAVTFLLALLEVSDLMQREPDRDVLDQLLVAIEQIRQVIRDALDERVRGIEGDTGVVIGHLLELLPGVRRADVAELLGVDRRTLSRWEQSAAAPTPRLRAVARVVAVLEHNWTREGALAWFRRPRRDLEGRTPLALLAERTIDEGRLVMAARAGRSQYAS